LLDPEYREARRLSQKIAAELQPPRFYIEKRDEVEASLLMFRNDPMVAAGLAIIERRGALLGHGVSHASKVAVDAGALVLIEREAAGDEADYERMLRLAQLAGVFHDIRRDGPDHAAKGAEEAMRILEGFDLDEGECRAIARAIRNHEAFRPIAPLADGFQQLLSDALYDADKFRWGPDNFTDTVWAMVSRSQVPLSVLIEHFLPSMKGIERIKDTFRTETGKEYGPDFIMRGLEIGNRLYRELSGKSEEGEGRV
jgi:hypothetical protein